MKEKKNVIEWTKVASVLKKYQYALLVLLAGLVLLALPTGREKQAETTAHSTVEAPQEDSTAALEERLAGTLSQMKGVGKAEVILTLAAGSERILATDEKGGEEGQSATVILRNGSNQETTVTTQTIYPTFQGALVVCDGGENATVRLNVIRAVQALTGLKAGSISVCARTGGNDS